MSILFELLIFAMQKTKIMNIIITGGHSGLGLELTKMLLEEGHQTDKRC